MDINDSPGFTVERLQSAQLSNAVKVLTTDPDADVGEFVQRAYADDCGLDLFVQSNPNQAILREVGGTLGHFVADEGAWVIGPGAWLDLPLGVSVQLPRGTWGMLTGRSSTLRKRGLLVAQGIIDHGYRGPLLAGCWNLTDHAVLVEAGAKLAQLIVLPAWGGRVVAVDQLDDHPRGWRGFGSSGE